MAMDKAFVAGLVRKTFTNGEDRIDDPESQHEAIGIAVSQYVEWDGGRILDVAIAAFEDSNYHTLASWLDEHREELLDYDSSVGIVIKQEADKE